MKIKSCNVECKKLNLDLLVAYKMKENKETKMIIKYIQRLIFEITSSRKMSRTDSPRKIFCTQKKINIFRRLKRSSYEVASKLLLL